MVGPTYNTTLDDQIVQGWEANDQDGGPDAGVRTQSKNQLIVQEAM